MDPINEQTVSGGNFLFASNRHLYEWISENDIRQKQIDDFMKSTDRQYASKQPSFDKRAIEKAEIYDTVERIYEQRSKLAQENGGFKEDYLSNETDPSIKLN
jgi:hypothetical protein